MDATKEAIYIDALNTFLDYRFACSDTPCATRDGKNRLDKMLYEAEDKALKAVKYGAAEAKDLLAKLKNMELELEAVKAQFANAKKAIESLPTEILCKLALDKLEADARRDIYHDAGK